MHKFIHDSLLRFYEIMIFRYFHLILIRDLVNLFRSTDACLVWSSYIEELAVPTIEYNIVDFQSPTLSQSWTI